MYWSKIRDPGDARRIADLAVYDMTNENIEFLLKDKKFLMNNFYFGYVSYAFFSSPSGVTYYSPRFSEIIYAIDEKGVRPAIGIRNLRKPPEHVIREWEEDGRNLKLRSMDEDKLYFKENTHIYETDKHIVFRCINGSSIPYNYLIYDKQSGTCSSVSAIFFTLHLGINGPVGIAGKDFFDIMYPNPAGREHRQLLESREELKNWKEDDNPVIVFFNLDI
jgi:hypothetical protein